MDKKQLLALKESRSLIAEAALVLELDAGGQATSTFTSELVEQAQDQLKSAATKIPINSPASRMIEQAMAALDDRDPSELSSIASKLSEIERGNEPAS